MLPHDALTFDVGRTTTDENNITIVTQTTRKKIITNDLHWQIKIVDLDTSSVKFVNVLLNIYMMKGHPLWTGIVHINPDVEKFRIKPMKIPENVRWKNLYYKTVNVSTH